MDILSLLSILSKFALYIGILFAVGTVFYRLMFEHDGARAIFSFRKATSIFSVIGLAAALASYEIRAANLVGDFSGMFDPEILGILWQTPVGTALLMRVIGLSLLLFGLFVSWGRIISIFGSLVALASFIQIGHVTESNGYLLQVLLLVHLVGIALWLGILLPLYRLSANPAHLEVTADIAHRFGQIATLFVPILLIAGGWLALKLAGSIEVLLTTEYGRTLLLKIALVAVLLALATANKLRFVPALRRGDQTALSHLNLSVRIEGLFVLLILITTAVLTSVLTLPEIQS